MIQPEIDWSYVGERVLLFAIGVGTAWNTWKGNQRSLQLTQIHMLSNSAMGVVKKSLAQVTAAKYVITKDPVDEKMANDAMADYLEHEVRQNQARDKLP